MIFVKPNNYASSMLRADQIANAIGAQVYLNDLPDDVSRETVVFVKDADPDLVIKASTGGAKIVYDALDRFAYPEREKWEHWFYFVDTVIAYSEQQADYYRETYFKNTVVIPHQWDERLHDVAPLDKFRPGYIGYRFNCPKEVLDSGIAVIDNPQDMMNWASMFNLHVSVREVSSLQSKMKPATKVSTAAAVGAVIITSQDDAVMEILDIDYPYWCNHAADFPQVLARAKDEFNGPVWDKAMAMMEEVKEKTSLAAIANKYMGL